MSPGTVPPPPKTEEGLEVSPGGPITSCCRRVSNHPHICFYPNLGHYNPTILASQNFPLSCFWPFVHVFHTWISLHSSFCLDKSHFLSALHFDITFPEPPWTVLSAPNTCSQNTLCYFITEHSFYSLIIAYLSAFPWEHRLYHSIL